MTTETIPQSAFGSAGSAGARVRGLNRACESIQQRIQAACSAPEERQAHALRVLGAEIHEILETVGVACERAGIDPRELPDPARRALAWLGVLADADYRQSHLEALQAANAIDARVRLRFYNTTSLYRFTPGGETMNLTAHEAFVGAPVEVLRSLVRLGVPYSRKRQHRAAVTTYTETAGFRAALAELDRFRRPAADAGRGRHIDLAEVFGRVNHAYFEGQLPRPHLTWSRSVLRNEFGRYEASHDTVAINRALDRADVSELVVEYVMYHELLHKALGVRVQAGRRQVHSHAFRKAEMLFVRRTEAESALRRLGEQLRRR